MFGMSPLIEAAYDGKFATISFLLSKGKTDINAGDKLTGHTALIWAADKGHADIVRLLLAQPGIDVNVAGKTGVTALMLAAKKGDLDIVRQLLAHKNINVNHTSMHGATAMINAAGLGHKDIVLELLTVEDIKLDATYTDKKHTPLTIAKQNGHPEVLKILEEFAANKTKPATPKPPRP